VCVCGFALARARRCVQFCSVIRALFLTWWSFVRSMREDRCPQQGYESNYTTR